MLSGARAEILSGVGSSLLPPAGVDVPNATAALSSISSTTTTALAAAATFTMTTTAMMPPPPPPGGHPWGPGGPPPPEAGECRLLGPFALFVQLALGGLALLSLVYKRWRERPQRPVKIWFFDASKQVFGSVLVHIANVFMSMLTSGRISMKLGPAAVQTVVRLMRRDDEPYIPNPCSFYLLNLAIDTTAGIPVLIILLRIITGLVAYTPWGKPAESIQSGNYGSPPNAWWWLKQSIIYFCGLFGMKICVLILFLMLPWISRIGDWALRWTEGNEKVQIVFVMMLFPLIMNAMQYYIIDSFIKKKEAFHHERLPSDPREHMDPFDDALLDDSDSDDDGDVASSHASSDDVRLSRSKSFEGRARRGSGHQNRSQERRLLPKELVPAE